MIVPDLFRLVSEVSFEVSRHQSKLVSLVSSPYRGRHRDTNDTNDTTGWWHQ